MERLPPKSSEILSEFLKEISKRLLGDLGSLWKNEFAENLGKDLGKFWEGFWGNFGEEFQEILGERMCSEGRVSEIPRDFWGEDFGKIKSLKIWKVENSEKR